MHIHILGICGTFMGGIARLAIEKGYKVTGSDQNCYPPMSTQLESLGIELQQGFSASQLSADIDCVVVGNAMSRGVEVVEALLNSNQKYCSGPQWLKENILHDKWVIAVAGTHGKTSTSSMVAWILEHTGYNPGFLIGGVMENFGVSARLTDSPFFVVEADEYDTAFFDKRSKFIHYRARTCVLNNLEFDHADIFPDLAAIENQFHHLVRTIPGDGLIIRPVESEALDRVINKGCWSSMQSFSGSFSDSSSDLEKKYSADWQANVIESDGSQFEIYFQGEKQALLNWSLIGQHNVNNALAAIAACKHVGVLCEDAAQALTSFKNVKRRMELKGKIKGISVYDDFAHHPTAIQSTLQGLKAKIENEKEGKDKGRILAAIDLRSNTMKMGFHKDTLADAACLADQVFFHLPKDYDWQINFKNHQQMTRFFSTQEILAHLLAISQAGDTILLMSNGSFDGIHEKLLKRLKDDC